MDRYHRQILLPQIGKEGQKRLQNSSIFIAGIGALGCTIADQLCRSGLGKMVLVDRDVVDSTNLHRQILFTEQDTQNPVPKVIAAENALRRINPECNVLPVLEDIHPGNIKRLLETHQPDIIVDATDNVATRFLLNDAAIDRNIPLVYGGCVGTEGRLATIIPGLTPCLRCLFPKPPSPSELPTCDTAGILGPVAAIIGAMQAAEVIKLIVSDRSTIQSQLVSIELWNNRFRTIDTTGQINTECPACQKKNLEYLDSKSSGAISLCGRNTVQYRLEQECEDRFLDRIETKLKSAGKKIFRSQYLVQFQIDEVQSLEVFADGRVLIHGCSDPKQARTIISRWLG